MKKTFKITIIIMTISLFGFAQNNLTTMKNKIIIGHTIHGNGDKKVIVLHSWMGDYESWNPTIPYLDLDKHTYVFMDVRGYGKSKEIKGKFTSDEIANDIFNLADNLEWDRFYIIGHSMTGMAAQKAALLDRKNRIVKIVAITPVSSAGMSVDEQTLVFFKSIIQNNAMAKVGFGAFTSNRLTDKWASLSAQRHLKVTDADAQMAYINMWTGENFADEVNTIQTPFLVIAGQYDHPGLVLNVQKEAFKDFQNVTFLEAENSGHFPMQETPIFLATSIENYISEDKNNK